jgi:PAS domain S-box-containing protein
MINYTALREAQNFFSRKDIPLLLGLIARMERERPYQGLDIFYNSHLTLSSILQIEALLLSGAEVRVTVADHLRCDPAALAILKKANVQFVPFDSIQNEQCDVMLDCCASLLGKVRPRKGAIELTQTGDIKFAQQKLTYPVISVDNSEVKKIETYFGTGDGFIRGFRKLATTGLNNKKFVLFGYGKVGKGIVHALASLTSQVVVIEHDSNKVNEARSDGILAYFIEDKKNILPHLKDAYCIVTATGVKEMVSNYFERSDVQAKYLANMGSEDEWGSKFAASEILGDKLAINFFLEQPTRAVFLDPIFYAQNTAIDTLLPGLHAYPAACDLHVLNRWIMEHYQFNVEGDYVHRIIEHIPCFIYWKDKDSVYQGCNEPFAKVAGVSHPKDIVGKTDYELVWGSTEAETYRKSDQAAFEGKALINIEETQQQADGKNVIVLASKVPYRDTDGNIIGVLGIYTDITERKQQEKELTLAKERAEAANQAKTEFLENMRHDIRTPLTGIIGFAKIIQDEAKSPKIEEYTDNLTASSQALLDLLNEVLETVSVTSGEIPHLKKKFDLRAKLDSIVALYQAKAYEKKLHLRLEYDANIPPYLIGDPRRIHRIALELVGNALNFTHQGDITVKVELASRYEQKAIVKLSVIDSGIGIALDKQEDVFVRFKRLTPSYEGIYKGAGLGLTIVKQFMDDMNGEIYLDSQPQKGTTFTCIIPLDISLLADAEGVDQSTYPVPFSLLNSIKTPISPTQAAVAPLTEALPTTLQPVRILLVEDQLIPAKAAQMMLQPLNCQVDWAETGQKAVLLALENNYDLIFMDVGLPDINGDEATRRIRQWETTHNRHVPIVALTAHIDTENKQLCVEAGMEAVLSKPLSKEKAEDILCAFIPSRHTSQEPIPIPPQTTSMEAFPPITGPVLDLESVAQTQGFEMDMVKEMLEMMLSALPDSSQQMETAYQQQDWNGLTKLVHKLRGSASYCGAPRLFMACQQLENYLREDKTEFAEMLYQRLKEEVAAVQASEQAQIH